MKPSSNHPWNPDPQLLAAYFDGEFEGCPDLADLRARVEAWLEQHPQSSLDAKPNQWLREAMQNTAPPEPSPEAWKQTLARIDEGRRRPLPKQGAGRSWLTASACAVGIALGFALLYGLLPHRGSPVEDKGQAIAPPTREQPKPAENMDVLPVAVASEIVVLRIEGADTASLVVGLLPLIGPLELAAPGDVRVLHARPDARDRMVPRVRQDGPNRPMIWARMDAEAVVE